MIHSASPKAGSLLQVGTQRYVRRVTDSVQGRALVARLVEDARAHLTDAALGHVGSLTTFETHLIAVAPSGTARYRELIDSYTVAAGASIRRFG